MSSTLPTFGRIHVPTDSVMRHIRAAEWLERSSLPGGRRLGHVVRYRLAKSWGVFVHASARVGDVRFRHPTSVVIGAGVVIEDDVVIYQNVTLGILSSDDRGYPTVRKGAVIYAGATVAGNIEIGENAVVGAHSLVLSDVAPRTTVVGCPAKVVRGRNPDETLVSHLE